MRKDDVNLIIKVTMVFSNTFNLNQSDQSTWLNVGNHQHIMRMITNGKLHHHGTPWKSAGKMVPAHMEVMTSNPKPKFCKLINNFSCLNI